MSEWSNVPAWKASIVKAIGGSNPLLSATSEKKQAQNLFALAFFLPQNAARDYLLQSFRLRGSLPRRGRLSPRKLRLPSPFQGAERLSLLKSFTIKHVGFIFPSSVSNTVYFSSSSEKLSDSSSSVGVKTACKTSSAAS